MQKPELAATLRNTYETEQLSLAVLFSAAARDAGFAVEACARGGQCYSQA